MFESQVSPSHHKGIDEVNAIGEAYGSVCEHNTCDDFEVDVEAHECPSEHHQSHETEGCPFEQKGVKKSYHNPDLLTVMPFIEQKGTAQNTSASVNMVQLYRVVTVVKRCMKFIVDVHFAMSFISVIILYL